MTDHSQSKKPKSKKPNKHRAFRSYTSATARQALDLHRVLIYANPSKPKTADCLKELCGILKKQGIKLVIYSENAPSRTHLARYIEQALGSENPAIRSKSGELFDLVITVGGDGTVLKYLSYSPFREIPVLPINTGSLGYITSISFHKLSESIDAILCGAFVYSPRILLSARILDKYQNPKHHENLFALNEIAISSCRAGLLAEMELQVGNSCIPLQGDGIILATPTGSTAYSLAAGGPIVDAEMEALIITPVSPFSLATRPVVVPSNIRLFVRNAAGFTDAAARIESPIEYQGETPSIGGLDMSELQDLNSANAPLSVAVDGWFLGLLYPGESIHIIGGDERLQFLATSHNNSYFEHIRSKLGWHSVIHRRPQTP